MMLAFPAFAASAIIVMTRIFGSKVNQRINSEGLFDFGHWNVYLSPLRIMEDHSWLGIGPGTFR